MAAMLRLAAVILSASLVGCAQVSPSDSGSGGSGGQSGAGGAGGGAGMDGEGGTGGAGGSGGTGGVDSCAVVLPSQESDTEEDDLVSELGMAEGSVSGACVGGSCSGVDPYDRWTFTPCAGRHDVVLTWGDSTRDLDLYLFDADNTQIAQSATPDTTEESIRATLDAESTPRSSEASSSKSAAGRSARLRRNKVR